jgi:predicted nucleic acid-binding protein
VTDDFYILDTGPLGLITNPKESAEGRRCKAWVWSVLGTGAHVIVPDVVDYEVRRELTRAGKAKGLARLDSLVDDLERAPIDLRVWQLAAELWAQARRQGKPTAKDDALDADLLIAAVAQLAAEDGTRVVVVTDNPAHIGRFVNAQDWRTLANPTS